jgi:N-acyl-D-aspartate/D-glutamate deacylase
MTYDLIVKNGWIVDGTGLPKYWGDVAAAEGQIVEIGRVRGAARRTIDADGRVIAPGFIDMHTHFDAQITWDPIATSSCWHGFTSVVFGNCGFAVAPCRPEDRDYLMLMLMRVEGMDLDVLRTGTKWAWETVPEYMDALAGKLGVNAGVMLGHSAIRYYVMGPDSYERTATADEIAQMQAIIRDGLRAGALGFSTSRQPGHYAGNGKPVPSLLASKDEILDLVRVLGELNVGSVEIVPGADGSAGLYGDAVPLVLEMARVSGRPLNWNTLIAQPARPEGWRGQLEFMEKAFADERTQVWAMNTCYRLDRWFSLRRNPERPFGPFPAWKELLALPPEKRAERLRDPEVRDRLRAAMAGYRPNIYRDFTDVTVAEPKLEKNRPLIGLSVAELARQRGVDPFDALLDLSLEEDLDTKFNFPMSNDDEAAVAEIVRHPYSVPGTSDAGAHMDAACGYGVPAELLGKWVRDKGVLTLEEGVRRLTSMPAVVAGIPNRGLIREGMPADLTIFDPQAIRALEPQAATDLPGGGWRLVQGCAGIAATIVNGEVLIEDSKHTGALPGQVLRNRLAVGRPAAVPA